MARERQPRAGPELRDQRRHRQHFGRRERGGQHHASRDRGQRVGVDGPAPTAWRGQSQSSVHREVQHEHGPARLGLRQQERQHTRAREKVHRARSRTHEQRGQQRPPNIGQLGPVAAEYATGDPARQREREPAEDRDESRHLTCRAAEIVHAPYRGEVCEHGTCLQPHHVAKRNREDGKGRERWVVGVADRELPSAEERTPKRKLAVLEHALTKQEVAYRAALEPVGLAAEVAKVEEHRRAEQPHYDHGSRGRRCAPGQGRPARC